MAKGQAKPRQKKPCPGRRPSARNRRSRELMLKADQGVSPAEVLLGVMRHYWALAHDDKLDDNDRAWALDKALSIAKEAAPYFHVEHSGKDGEILCELFEEETKQDCTHASVAP